MIVARSLFRPEALAAQSQQWLGGVQLVRPLSLSWLTAGAVAAALAVAAFLALAPYTRKATVDGVLAPDTGLVRVVPAMAGTVLERRVREGQTVAAGDVLFVLALDRAALLDSAEAQVQRSLAERRRSLDEASRAERALGSARLAALTSRVQALQTEQAQLDAEAALQAQRVVLAEQALTRLEGLQREQFISAAQVQAKAEELLALRAVAQSLARQKAALQRESAELQGELRALPLQASGSAGGLDRERALLEREAAEQTGQRQMVLRAPRAGVVSTLLADPGQAVTPAAALATLVPEGAVLQAQLYAPSSAVGFVQAGQAVRLRFEPFAYQKYGHHSGQVLQVSRTPLAPSELAALSLPAAAVGTEALFRITVALDPEAAQALPLAAGMRLQADVLLERRRLLEWLFEPLMGLRQRL